MARESFLQPKLIKIFFWHIDFSPQKLARVTLSTWGRQPGRNFRWAEAAIEALPIATRGKELTFYVHNEGMIKAVMSPVANSKIVKECKDYLNMVEKCNRICLKWISGHSVVEGNKRADVLAETRGPETFLPVRIVWKWGMWNAGLRMKEELTRTTSSESLTPNGPKICSAWTEVASPEWFEQLLRIAG